MGLRKLWELVGIGTDRRGKPLAAPVGRRRRPVRAGERRGDRPGRPGRPLRRIRVSTPTSSSWRWVRSRGRTWLPGMAEHAHDVWDRARVPEARAALEAFGGGRVAVVIAGAPYPVSAGAVRVRDAGGRVAARPRSAGADRADRVDVPADPAAERGARGLRVARASSSRPAGIDARTGRKVERFEPGRVVYADGELEADLVFGVPPHRVPAVVADSALADDGHWIARRSGHARDRASRACSRSAT